MASPPSHTQTSILLLAIVTLFSAGFTVGLTFLPCYSAMCVEEFFPYPARIHIAFFYSLLSSTAALLALRILFPSFRRLSRTYITPKPLPLIDKRLSLGGAFLIVWIVGLTHATLGYWQDDESNFWTSRGARVNWIPPMAHIAWTGVSGHWCDITLGLLIIPVSRNSLIGRVFSLHVSTLLFAHKLLAYALLGYVVIHGGLYYSFVGAYAAESRDVVKNAFNVDNPTLSINESDARRYWPYAVLPSGMIAFLLMLVITLTALPVLRRKSYNTFYYAHVICSVFVFIATCVHASTDFYFLLPGLLLWIADWGWRVSHALSTRVEAVIENAGNDWYRVRLPSSVYAGSPADGEKAVSNPLQTYYLNFPSISRIQVHAFTAAGVESSTGPYFLLQKSGAKKQKKLDKEWTWKLAALVSQRASMRKSLDVRVEGPYVPHVPELWEADNVLCVAGGTGITGALCLANWWLSTRAGNAGDRRSKFRLVWSVRNRETAELDEVVELRRRIEETANSGFRLHVSAGNGRLDAERCLEEFCFDPDRPILEESKEGTATESTRGKTWVYCSGPDGLLEATETACIKVEKEIRRSKKKQAARGRVETLEWYIARWSL